MNLEKLFARYASSGSPRDLAEVFDRTAPELLRLALHLRQEGEAEDLLQATFLTAMQKARRFDPRQPLLPWLCGILANHARRQAKAARKRPVVQEETPEPDPADRAASAELQSSLRSALEKLEEGYRSPLQLRLIEGLSTVEIAWRLRRSPGAVRVAIHRGLDKLRRLLPPGLALAAGILLPGRGLAAVRASVVSQASAPIGSTLMLGGILMMKKILAVAALFLAVLILWWAVPGAPEVPVLPMSRAPGSGESQVADAAGEIADDVEVRLGGRERLAPDGRDAAGLTLRVRWQKDGLPAVGVLVRVDPQDGLDPRFHDLEGRTGLDGTVHFESVPPGRTQVTLDRRVEVERELHAGRETVVDIVVPAGTELRGRVVDGAGLPVPGAKVFLDPTTVFGDFVPGIVAPAAVADSDGRFHLPSLSRFTSIAARAAGRGHSRVMDVSTGDSGEAEPMILIIEGPGLDVHGRVVDRQGEGVPGALVTMGDRGRSNPARLPDGSTAGFWHGFYLRTDEDGRFVAEGVRPGASWVRVESPGHAPYLEELELRPHPGELTISLDPGAIVHGVVADTEGTPIPGAVVLPRERRIDLLRIARLMRTDPDGRFELGGLAPGPTRLLAHAEGYETLEGERILASGANVWSPRLRAMPEIRGIVVDEGGVALRGVRVLAYNTNPSPTGMVTGRADLPFLATTDGSGRFALAVLHDLEYRLSLTEEGAHFEVPSELPPLAGGGEELRITLADARRATARITGTLVDAADDPLGDSWLQLRHDGILRAVGDTDAKTGVFSIGLLSPGRYWLRASPRDPEQAPRTLGPFDLYPHQVLDLGRVKPPATGELLFSYTSPEGMRIEKISAHLDDAHGDTIVLGALPDVETRHELVPGDYTLDVFGTGFATIAEHPVRITEGQATRVAFALEAGQRRVFRFPVPAPEDWPVEGTAEVLLRRAGQTQPVLKRAVALRPDLGLAPTLGIGEYVLEVHLEDGRQLRGRFTIEDLEPTEEPIRVSMERVGR